MWVYKSYTHTHTKIYDRPLYLDIGNLAFLGLPCQREKQKFRANIKTSTTHTNTDNESPPLNNNNIICTAVFFIQSACLSDMITANSYISYIHTESSHTEVFHSLKMCTHKERMHLTRETCHYASSLTLYSIKTHHHLYNNT